MSRATTLPTSARAAARMVGSMLLALACASLIVLLGATSTARAADPLPVCSTAGEIAIQLSDGSARCVENTCEAVLGAEGRASECTQERAPLNASVPDAGSGISGVAPVRAPVTAAATTPAGDGAASSEDGVSVGIVLAWVFAGIGLAALLLGAVLLVRTRRTRAAAPDGEGPGATPTASA